MGTTIRRCGLASVLIAICAVFVGCSAISTDSVDNGVPQTQPSSTVDTLQAHVEDVQFFVQTGTTMALRKNQVPKEKVQELLGWVNAVEDLVATPNKPDFTGARELVNSKLSPGSRAVALAVVEIIERYVPKYLPQVDDQTAAHQVLASQALQAASRAMKEYQP